MKYAYSILGFLVLVILAVTPVQATVVTSLPDGTIIPMPIVNYFGQGPQVFGPGITWSSTNVTNFPSVFGYNGFYGFGDNGSWDGLIMAGLNDSSQYFGVTDTMTFTFGTPVTAVGGYLNYYRDITTTNFPTIAVYDVNDQLIEDAQLLFNFNDANALNANVFMGFRESTPIRSFTLTDNYIGIFDLTVGSPIPEPTSIALIGTGLCVLGFASFRRKRK